MWAHQHDILKELNVKVWKYIICRLIGYLNLITSSLIYQTGTVHDDDWGFYGLDYPYGSHTTAPYGDSVSNAG